MMSVRSELHREGLLDIRTFVIPQKVLCDTVDFLQQVGRRGFEGFVLWGGKREGKSRLNFHSAVIPDQRAMQTESGLLVQVDGKALFEVNRLLHAKEEILAAQVHSHPTQAYHSSTDDEFPLVTLLGALSIVVPDFARHAPADLPQWACYRLSRAAQWKLVDHNTEIEIQ